MQNSDTRFPSRGPRKRAISQVVVLVLGMHRSGTSALSGLLDILGVDVPGELMPATSDNEKGYFENARIVEFHARLLERLHSSWDDPLPLLDEWMETPLGSSAAQELGSLLEQELGSAPLVLVKDPRMCRLVPLWVAALERTGRQAVAIHPYRHPLEVAGSLQARDGLSRPRSLLLWLQHVVVAERATRGLQRSFVSYESLMRDWRAATEKLAADLSPALPHDLANLEGRIAAFVSSGLRHHNADAVTFSQKDMSESLCSDVWECLGLLERDPSDESAQRRLDGSRKRLVEACDVLGPLVAADRHALQEVTKQNTAEMKSYRDNAATAVQELRSHIATFEAEQIRSAATVQELRNHIAALEAEQIQSAAQLEARSLHIADLETEKKRLEHASAEQRDRGAALAATIGNLTEERGRLTARVAALESSTSWRLTSPLRKVRTFAKMMSSLLLRRTHQMEATPLLEILVTPEGGFVSTGTDPQLALASHRSRLPSGWCWLSIQMDASSRPLLAQLYAFDKFGSPPCLFHLPRLRPGLNRILIRLPDHVAALRLDPDEIARGSRDHRNHSAGTRQVQPPP